MDKRRQLKFERFEEELADKWLGEQSMRGVAIQEGGEGVGCGFNARYRGRIAEIKIERSCFF